MNSIEPFVPTDSVVREKGSARIRALKFAGVLALVSGGAGLWTLHRHGSVRTGNTLLAVAASLVVYALVHPAGALALRRVWLRLGSVLGRVNSFILLTVLYVVVVTPFGVVSRLVGRRSFKPARTDSYFVTREQRRDAKRFEQPF